MAELRLPCWAACTGSGQAEPGTVTALALLPGSPGGCGPRPAPASAVEFFFLYRPLLWLQSLGQLRGRETTAVEALVPYYADHCPGLSLSCPGLLAFFSHPCGPRPRLGRGFGAPAQV